MSISNHDCEQEADKHGRIVPECEGCYDRAYAEGQLLGGNAAIAFILEQTEEVAREYHDPLKRIDRREAMDAWVMVTNVREVVRIATDRLDKKINDRYEEVTRLP